MNSTDAIIIPEPHSKEIFEEYLRTIDILKNEDQNLHTSLRVLEDIIIGIERLLQDLTSSKLEKPDNYVVEINELVISFLTDWHLYLQILVDERLRTTPKIIEAFIYNFCPIVSLISNEGKLKNTEFLRYIKKLLPPKDRFPKKSTETNKYLNKVLHTRNKKDRDINEIIDRIKFEIADMEYKLPSNSKFVFQRLAESYKENALGKIPLELFKDYSLTEIVEWLSKFNFVYFIEQLFQFDDSKYNVIWKLDAKFEADIYKASEIGFFMWSFAKALEALDDVEVEIFEWGEGSKWVTFLIRIKSLSSKVDLKQILDNVVKSIEMLYLKKSVEELRKFDGETNKLQAEAAKLQAETNRIEKEVENIDPSVDKIIRELGIHDKLLELQRKEIENEDKKADVRLKHLALINGISDLIGKGIIQNNSDIQMELNDLLFFKKDKQGISLGNIEISEANEILEDKDIDSI